MQRHREIRKLIEANLLNEAVLSIDRTVAELGPHVGILCEQAGCYYELGRFQECWNLVSTIETQYLENHERLSANSKFRTQLMLAKFYEEMAEPAIALQKLQTAGHYTEDFNERKAIFANELRILAYFGFSKELQKKYAAVTEFRHTGDSLKVELLHGLLWAEWCLFGFEHARKRWADLENLSLNDIDRRLVARDFVEIWLRSNRPKCAEAEAARARLEAFGFAEYDASLLRLSSDGRPVTSSTDVENVSEMMRLRLLLLQIEIEKDPAVQRELKIKYQFLIEGVSKESKQLFKKTDPTFADNTLINLTIDLNDRRLISDRFGFKLSMTSLQLKFLLAFTRANAPFGSLTLDEVARKIWECPSSESIYHRIRMTGYKLNETIGSKTGLVPFEIRKEGVRLHANLRLQESSKTVSFF